MAGHGRWVAVPPEKAQGVKNIVQIIWLFPGNLLSCDWLTAMAHEKNRFPNAETEAN